VSDIYRHAFPISRRLGGGKWEPLTLVLPPTLFVNVPGVLSH
jgi:hypothetical protein